MLDLREATSPTWIEVVLENLDAFLLDHAACERKVSATAMLFVVRYPDRTELIDPMVELAIEELGHFRRVCALIRQRGLTLISDRADPYIDRLMSAVRTGRDERLLDRLLVGAICERRGGERFGLLAAALEPGAIADLYADLVRDDARHHALFLRLARRYFEPDAIRSRADALLAVEADAVRTLPVGPTLFG